MGTNLRSIPAWAGKPPGRNVDTISKEVHPRVGGETAGSDTSSPPMDGPSPRGRGNPRVDSRVGSRGGSIPAWAGKP